MKAPRGRVAALGAGLLLVLVFAGMALAQYPTRERLSAPAASASAAAVFVGTSPITVTGGGSDGGTISIACAGAGKAGALCPAGGDNTATYQTLDAGLVVYGSIQSGYSTSPPANGQILSIGGIGAGAGALWGPVTTPSASNYAFQATSIATYVNAPSTIGGSIADGALLWQCGASGCDFTQSVNKGIATLSGGGTATVTVRANAVCTCTYSTVGIIILLCNVASTTLTITGTAGAAVGYHCF